jgi:hypothetical protein
VKGETYIVVANSFSYIPFKRLMGIQCNVCIYIYMYMDLCICIRMCESAFPLQHLKQVAKFNEIL